MNCIPESNTSSLKSDLIATWLETEWIPAHADQSLVTLKPQIMDYFDTRVLRRYDHEFQLGSGFRYTGSDPVDCPVASRMLVQVAGGLFLHRMGAYLYHFAREDENVDVLVVSGYYSDQGHMMGIVCAPQDFTGVWASFMRECNRIARTLNPQPQVVVIGGKRDSFVPTVDWQDIILPDGLKDDILSDVESFFSRGIEVYKRLKLKPFRKLLLAGVPGTGKTMICNALAKWCIDRHYLVIYISSGDPYRSTFDKIEHALGVASTSNVPTLIILEELDAYLLKKEEKAVILNVLDGAESAENDSGTLLISTTNYPEAIDERVLKRPGRLDRIFIVPEVKTQANATDMLRQYLGVMWDDAHSVIADQLVGYPGAFVREVAIHALTQVAYTEMTHLPLEMLEVSFTRLQDQMNAKDDFLIKQLNENVVSNGHAGD